MIPTIRTNIEEAKISAIELAEDVYKECMPPPLNEENLKKAKKFARKWIHIPFLPAFHRPGWLLRYIVGPFNSDWLEGVVADFIAGLTVALTLVPQGLSFGALANLPPINGLYAAILPSATYTFFGSSMALAVGPTAIVSLMTGELIAELVPEFAEDPQKALDCAAELALCVGMILTIMSLLNLGDIIRYVSYPVMSGFTSGAACQIGLSQMRTAIGSLVQIPQTGQELNGHKYEYNYEVFEYLSDKWNTQDPKTGLDIQNPYACKICFGLYIPLILVVLLKNYIKETPERKKSIPFRIWQFAGNLMPLFAILIGTRIAKDLILDADPSTGDADDIYASKIDVVKSVPSGLDIMRIPHFEFGFGKIFQKSLALIVVVYVESWSIARKLADVRGELHLLNAGQEMWSNGVANVLACVSSAYPVTGSYSRSSLNHSAGAKTPLSKVTTLVVISIVVASKEITESMYYIPKAALAAIIFAAIYNLISVAELWEAWKFSKKDFLTMLTAWVTTLVFNTEVGLASGVACSILVQLADLAFHSQNAPVLEQKASENGGIDVVKCYGDLNFVSIGRFKFFMTALTTLQAKEIHKDSSLSHVLFYKISTFLENLLGGNKLKTVEVLPKAVAVDFTFVRVMDLAGLEGLDSVLRELRSRGVLVVLFNTSEWVTSLISKYGLKNDTTQGDIDLERFLEKSQLAILPPSKKHASDDAGDEEL